MAVENNLLVLNPDELGPDPSAGMDLAVDLKIGSLEIRSAFGDNALLLTDDSLRRIRGMAEDRGLTVTALASPLWKWCSPAAQPGQVDSFGFPTLVPTGDRSFWVERAFEVARILGSSIVRVFSHLRVGSELTESFAGDPLLIKALESAERAGVRLLLENEPVCTVAHAETLLEVLHRHRERGLGLWLDVANLHEVGQASSEVVNELAPFVEYVHVKDYRLGENTGRVFCAAGTGTVPYLDVLPLLQRARPALPYALETHVRDATADALQTGAAFLRDALSGRPR